MATTPAQDLANLFRTRYGKITRPVIDDLIRQLPKMTKYNMKNIVASTLKKHNINAKLYSELMNDIVKTVNTTMTGIVSGVVIKDSILSKSWSSDGVRFSSRVNNLSQMDEVFKVLRRGLTYQEKVNELAVDIFRTGVQKEDVTKLISELEDSARLMARNAGDINISRDFMREVHKTQSHVERLTRPDTSTLRRAYQNVVDAAKEMNEEALTRSVKYAGYFKQKYNAQRIADTELSRAYGNAVQSEALYNSDVTGIMVTLSSAHNITDICDFYANADLYGMGKGVYPKDLLPDYPFHPNCHCILDEVYEIETEQAGADDFNPKKVESFLNSLSERDRRHLLGVEGAEEYADKRSSWKENLRNFNINKKSTPLLEGARHG